MRRHGTLRSSWSQWGLSSFSEGGAASLRCASQRSGVVVASDAQIQLGGEAAALAHRSGSKLPASSQTLRTRITASLRLPRALPPLRRQHQDCPASCAQSMRAVAPALSTMHPCKAAIILGASAQRLEVLLSSIQAELELSNSGSTYWAVLPHVTSAGG